MSTPRPFPLGPQASEAEALAAIESTLETLYPVHNLRLVLSASDEVREAVCAAYRRKGYEARAIPEGVYLHHDEDGREKRAEMAAFDEQRWSAREREDRRLVHIRGEDFES